MARRSQEEFKISEECITTGQDIYLRTSNASSGPQDLAFNDTYDFYDLYEFHGNYSILRLVGT